MNAETEPSARLRQAAEVLRKRSAEATPGPWSYRRWHSDSCQIGCDDPSCFLLLVGTAHAMVGDANVDREPEVFAVERSVQERGEDDAAWIALMGPTVGEPLAAVFDAWARMGEYDPMQLNRVGGRETVALADQILAAASR